MKSFKERLSALQQNYRDLRTSFANKTLPQKVLLTAQAAVSPAFYLGKKIIILVLPSHVGRSVPRIRNEFRKASLGGKAWLGTKLALKGVGIWLWPPAARFERPFSRIGAVKKLKRGIKAAAAIIGVVLLQNVVQVGTAQLFPTGEKFLTSQGIDPKYAKEISDHRIRVRGRDFWGRLHATFDIPTIIGAAQSLAMQSESVQAWAIPGLSNDVKGESHTNFRNDCMVMLPPSGMTAKQAVSAFTNIPEDMIEYLPASDREVVLSATFHEFAHCDTQNRKTDFREEDADLRGLTMAAEITGNKELPAIFMHARAMNTSPGNHDTALYLDAARRHEKFPADFSEATNDAKNLFRLAEIYKDRIRAKDKTARLLTEMTHISTMDNRQSFIKEVEAIRYVLKNHRDLLSPAAIRRGELYIEAAEYFAPKATALAVPDNAPGPLVN